MQSETSKVDNLGRLLIPAPMRHRLGINVDRDTDASTNNQVEIQCDGSQITVKPLRALCFFCGCEATKEVGGRGLCEDCIEAIKSV